jgi:hypothetical protein
MRCSYSVTVHCLFLSLSVYLWCNYVTRNIPYPVCRKSLFPGKNFVHQLQLIFEVIGSPLPSQVHRCRFSSPLLSPLPFSSPLLSPVFFSTLDSSPLYYSFLVIALLYSCHLSIPYPSSSISFTSSPSTSCPPSPSPPTGSPHHKSTGEEIPGDPGGAAEGVLKECL